jgi:arabinan endo-1,5-alpha-L-arabinosidase
MYTDAYADVQTTTSTAHDPTGVTVYTLTNGNQVGIEYIEKNNISSEQIADIDYYIFGTGMTIQHSKDNVDWEVIGDKEGRCGYQNEDLFGSVYTTALAEPLAYAANDTRAGAGYLVWAPHVMYNISLNKWCYYGSTSSWGSQTSAIFLATSDSPTGPYTYKKIVTTSSGHPNAIDPCVYYDKDYTTLYMLWGSWVGDNAIYVKKLSADGTDIGDGRSSLLCCGINSSLEGASDGGSGEGAYVVYDSETDYYYLYISYGQNTGSYVERVFRSKQPDSGFVSIKGIGATDTTTSGTHGNQILSSYDNAVNDYLYVSTGHNSVYKV